MKTNQNEDQAVENEGKRVPYSQGLQAHVRRKEMRALAAEVESTSNYGEHPRSSNGISRKVRDIRSKNAERDLDGSILETARNVGGIEV